VQTALRKSKSFGSTYFDYADLTFFFANGLNRAKQPTASTSVTEFREYQNLAFQTYDGTVLADFAALAAAGTFFGIHLGNWHRDRAGETNLRVDEYVAIGLFNITVQQSYIATCQRGHRGQIRCNRSLTRTTFAASYGYLHVSFPLVRGCCPKGYV
jgi:hypothetical protein